MAYPQELKDDPAEYEMSKFMTTAWNDSSITMFHMLDENGYLPIQYHKDSSQAEDSLTGWKIISCDTLFRTWDELVEYWPIHNSKMLARAK